MRPVLVLLAIAACGDNHQKPDAATGDGGSGVDAMHDAAIDANPNMPATLADTGLCLDPSCSQISPDVHAYTPQFPLWSDAATKRRWIYLPPGTTIDTTDPDHWVFPVGTKLWKEFTSDGVRVETRFIKRVSDATGTSTDWFYVAYAWNATQDATTAVPFGVMNANGTQHDIPSRTQCKQCHERLPPSRILGFQAIQLDWTNPAAGELDLDHVIAAGMLTQNPPGASSPHYPVPGTGAPHDAIGYLHANCGHCHNPNSTVYTDNGIHMVLRLSTGALGSLSLTGPYQTALDHDAAMAINNETKIAVTGQPDQSILIYRFETNNPADHMPQIGSEVVDPAADATLRAWITSP